MGLTLPSQIVIAPTHKKLQLLDNLWGMSFQEKLPQGHMKDQRINGA